MSLLKFPIFNNFLENILLNEGHNYIEATNPVTSKFLNEFAKGIVEYRELVYQRMAQRGLGPQNETDSDLINRLIEEDSTFLVDGRGNHEDEKELEMGRRPINTLEYFSQLELYEKLLIGLNNRHALTKQELKEILLDDKSKIVFKQGEEFEVENYENSSMLHFSSTSDQLNALYQISAVRKITSLFQELQVLESGNKRDLDRIIWNIYCEESDIEEVEDVDYALQQTGIRYLTLQQLIPFHNRDVNSPRTFFEQVKLYAARNIFREGIAYREGILDEDICDVKINEELEMFCFEKQYQTMDEKTRNFMDREEEALLRRIAMRNGIQLSLPLTHTTPFKIKEEGGLHTLEYQLN